MYCKPPTSVLFNLNQEAPESILTGSLYYNLQKSLLVVVLWETVGTDTFFQDSLIKQNVFKVMFDQFNY